MLKTIRVGVFRLKREGDDPPRSLIDVVRAVNTLQHEERAKLLRNEPIRPRDNIHVGDDYCLLDFTRIRQIDQIPTSNLRGEEGSIPFGGQDKKPREDTAVLLDHRCNMIYIHERPYGVSHAMVARYLQLVGGIDYLPVEVAMHLEGLLRLEGKSPVAFRVRLAGIDDATALGRAGYGDDAIARLLERFRAVDATVRLGLESEAQTPGALGEIIEVATEILGWNNRFGRKRPVKEVAIEAADGDDSPDIVSLVKDRIVYRETLELDGREPNDAERYRAVRNAWEKFGGDLRSRYTVSHAD